MSDQSALAAMVEASPDGMLLVASTGQIVFANGAASKLFGYDRDGLVGLRVEELMPPAQRTDHIELRTSYFDEPTSRPMETGLELLAQRADSTLVPVEISLSPVRVDGDQHTIATVRDVSDRNRVAAKIAIFVDRERIARDIHDMVIQRLFAAGMQLQAVSGIAEPPSVVERIAKVVDELDNTIHDLRNAIFQLGVQDSGTTLSERVVALVEGRRRYLGFVPDLEIVGDIDAVPDFVGDQLIATVTESLSNVARHANATEASVRVAMSGGTLALVVADNGVGIGGSRKPNGGLSNILWRATELGGTCIVQSAEPNGTVIAWNVPI